MQLCCHGNSWMRSGITCVTAALLQWWCHRKRLMMSAAVCSKNLRTRKGSEVFSLDHIRLLEGVNRRGVLQTGRLIRTCFTESKLCATERGELMKNGVFFNPQLFFIICRSCCVCFITFTVLFILKQPAGEAMFVQIGICFILHVCVDSDCTQ